MHPGWAVLKPNKTGGGEMEAQKADHVEQPNVGKKIEKEAWLLNYRCIACMSHWASASSWIHSHWSPLRAAKDACHNRTLAENLDTLKPPGSLTWAGLWRNSLIMVRFTCMKRGDSGATRHIWTGSWVQRWCMYVPRALAILIATPFLNGSFFEAVGEDHVDGIDNGLAWIPCCSSWGDARVEIPAWMRGKLPAPEESLRRLW